MCDEGLGTVRVCEACKNGALGGAEGRWNGDMMEKRPRSTLVDTIRNGFRTVDGGPASNGNDGVDAGVLNDQIGGLV